MAQTRLKGFPLRIWDGSFSQISRKMSWERGLFWSVAYAHAQRHNRLLSTPKSKKVKLDCHVSAVSIKHFVAFQGYNLRFFYIRYTMFGDRDIKKKQPCFPIWRCPFSSRWQSAKDHEMECLVRFLLPAVLCGQNKIAKETSGSNTEPEVAFLTCTLFSFHIKVN